MEFMIDFHTPTVDVPVLADKKLYIDKQLSFTIWLKTYQSGANHYFSYPRIETSDERITQLYTVLTSEICVAVKLKVPICSKFDDFKGKWTHVGLFSMKMRMET